MMPVAGRSSSVLVHLHAAALLALAAAVSMTHGCNRHKVLPAARCMSDSDCVPAGRCVTGYCRLTAEMELSVSYVKIFRKSAMNGPLILDLVLVKEHGGPETSCDPPFSIRKEYPAPGWPLHRKIDGLSDGKYVATAFLDMNGSGTLEHGEIADSTVCYAQTPRKGTVTARCELELLYPF
jgi:hypothetical protein